MRAKTQTLIDRVYGEMLSHYRFLQATARQEHERYIIMRAALDPEDEDEAHELSFKADKAYAEVLQYERDIAQIKGMWEEEKLRGR